MATTGATLHPGFSTRVRPRSARLPYAWPLYALFGLFPLWWVLGFGAFIWPVMAGRCGCPGATASTCCS